MSDMGIKMSDIENLSDILPGRPEIIFTSTVFLSTGLHVLKVYTRLCTSCPNAYTMRCDVSVSEMNMKANKKYTKSCLLVYFLPAKDAKVDGIVLARDPRIGHLGPIFGHLDGFRQVLR